MKRKCRPVPVAQWQWFGNVAHFCCGRWCRFHLTTRVGKWLVSTVGEMVHPRDAGLTSASENEFLQREPLGRTVAGESHFETLVFLITDVCDCGCRLPHQNGNSVDSDRYDTRADATKGHMAMCRKWARRTA